MSIKQQQIKLISSYTHHIQISKTQQVLNILSNLANRKISIHIQHKGYRFCIECKQSFYSNSYKLRCKHQIHKSCLITIASKISNDKYDPQSLQKIQCKICKCKIPMTDIHNILTKKFVFDKQYQANLKLAKQIQNQDRKKIEQQLQNRKFDCNICGQQKLIQQFKTFQCDHKICKICTAQYINQKLSQGLFLEADILCPQCNIGIITQYIIKDCITQDNYSKLMTQRYKKIKSEGIEIRQCKGYLIKLRGQKVPLLLPPKQQLTQKQNTIYQEQLQRRCMALSKGIKVPQVEGQVIQCGALVSYDPIQNQNQKIIKCYVCKLQMCIKGCESSHKGNTCQKYKQWIQLNKKGDQVLDQALKATGMARCQNPNCKIPILRASGCDWIKCRCGWEICYKCSKTWKKTDPHYMSAHAQFNQANFLAKRK